MSLPAKQANFLVDGSESTHNLTTRSRIVTTLEPSSTRSDFFFEDWAMGEIMDP